MKKKQWRVSANVTQYHVQVVEAATADEAWKIALKDWGHETCQEWDSITPDGDPEEIEEIEEDEE
jgi:hypothetical protein